MIKVSISYKAAEDKWSSDATYLVDTTDHAVAVVTAVFKHSEAEHSQYDITSVHTALETNVLAPIHYVTTGK